MARALTEAELIKNIINVNYAGEYGAEKLYDAQIVITQKTHPDVAKRLIEIRSDEIRHKELFLTLMPKYKMRPCPLTWIWGAAGSLLGISTAILGKRHVAICVRAAEKTAHEHLATQVQFLHDKDERLARIIEQVDIEEQKHVDHSNVLKAHDSYTSYDKIVFKILYLICQITMWLVTRGQSSRLKCVLCPD